MEVSKKENIIISWLVWHFYEMPKFLFLVWKNYIAFGADFFSIPLLIETFFSPWRRYKSKYPKTFNVGEFFGALIYNIFSRIVGVVGRSILIILGILTLIFILFCGFIIILFWLLIPFILISLVLIFLLLN